MKAASKASIGRLAGVSMIAAVLIAVPAFAEETTTVTPLTDKNLCSQIDTVTTTSKSRITQRQTALATAFTDRLTALEAKNTTVKEKLTAARQEASDTFNQKVSALKNLSGLTDEQLVAIDTFKDAVTAAEKTRKTAVDQARETYRTALRDTVSTHQDNLTKAATAYGAVIDAAFSKAKSNCSSASALATLRSDIKAARNTLSSSTDSIKEVDAVKILMETRDTAIQSANQTFRSSVKASAETLATALGTTVSISEQSETDS